MKPNEIKKIDGTYRADRDKNKDVKFDSVQAFKPPTFLKGEKKKIFLNLIEELGLQGYNLLTSLDAPALVMLSDVYGEYIKVTRLIDKEGEIIQDFNNRNKLVSKQHPLLGYKRQLFSQVFDVLKQFGMTPSSRNKVEFKPNNNDDNDEFNF
ncbi:phage terminase small subunit P27 family [Belliella sp. DSM 107340]|uniref:Phage terminase small subunit P27 family n=1 Tax=Belliella calami TaxID=2923436 RepID=A0ABS9UIX7_9BACT|nr:phage terminase small subunit P27 family [Belliella calami]MCH7396575.1 phage terminase small subunit P27 family [Belliella calami]